MTALTPVQFGFRMVSRNAIAWHVHDVVVHEGISKPYTADVRVVIDASTDVDGSADQPNAAAWLGESCIVWWTRGAFKRQVCGIVLGVEDVGVAAGQRLYAIRMGPALALLAQQQQCRIFQDMTVVQIITQVVQRVFMPLQRTMRILLDRTPQPRVYCVQFDESDLAFVQRLLAQEGIAYYFSHGCERDVEEWTLVDDNRMFADPQHAFSGSIPLAHHDTSACQVEPIVELTRRDHASIAHAASDVFVWSDPHGTPRAEARTRAVSSNIPERIAFSGTDRYALGHYDDATIPLGATPPTLRAAVCGAQNRRDAQCMGAATLQGQSWVTGFMAGALATLDTGGSEHMPWLLTDVVHSGSNAGNHLVTAQTPWQGSVPHVHHDGGYANSFVAQPAQQPFRSALDDVHAPMMGPQTAIVVGPEDQQIYTDTFGRIKVRFSWDRGQDEGAERSADEDNTCWLRVVQPWAGAGFGGVFIPRIGMEVLVQFLGGHPDHPVVAGCLYNGANGVPYALPDNACISGFRSESVPPTTSLGYNELCFDDRAAHEEVRVHAARQLTVDVEQDRVLTVKGHDHQHIARGRVCRVDVNHAMMVGGAEEYVVGGAQAVVVGALQSITIGGEQSVQIGMQQRIAIMGEKRETIASHCQQQIGADGTVVMGGHGVLRIGGDHTMQNNGNMQWRIGKDRHDTVGGAYACEVSGGYDVRIAGEARHTTEKTVTYDMQQDCQQHVAQSYVLHANAITLRAQESIVLQAGDAQFTLHKDGRVQLQGTDIHLQAAGNAIIQGGKVAVN